MRQFHSEYLHLLDHFPISPRAVWRFHTDLPRTSPPYAPESSAAQQRDFLTHLHRTLNTPIRNRFLRLTADSPDLLAVIKQECVV